MSADATGGRGESAAHRPVVTLAALYGPRVAARLGVPLLDREIPEDVARRTGLPEEAVSDIDEKPRSGMERLVRTLGHKKHPRTSLRHSSRLLSLSLRRSDR